MNQVFADLSNNNSKFDAVTYRQNGHVFVAIKATEGATFIDQRHKPWCLAAGHLHIGVAHYHFGRPDEGHDPVTEARHFLSVAGPLAGDRDYLILDLERFGKGGLPRDPAWSKAFDAYIRRSTRFSTILYGSKSWLETAPASAWLAGPPYRFWDADWSDHDDFAPSGGVCVIRQTSDGSSGPEPHSLPGVGKCDVNHLRGHFASQVLSKA